MSAFVPFRTRFDEKADRLSRPPGPAKAAKLAKVWPEIVPADQNFSGFSNFSSGEGALAPRAVDETPRSASGLEERPGAPGADVDAARTEGSEWAAERFQQHYQSRTHEAEHIGGLPTGQAEALAFSECMHRWLRQNEPIEILPSLAQDPLRCHLCGDDITGRSDVIVTICGRWWHIVCHERWLAERYGRATEALRAMGIKPKPAVESPTEAA